MVSSELAAESATRRPARSCMRFSNLLLCTPAARGWLPRHHVRSDRGSFLQGKERPMKVLMILGLAAFLAPSGCSTNRHLLEPWHDKEQEASPELSENRGCCSVLHCDCGDCRDSGPCKCRPAPESNVMPQNGVIP